MQPDTAPFPTKPSKNPRDLRDAERVDVEADVTFESESNFYQGFSENISEGGLFLVTYLTRKPGETLTVRFSLPGVERIFEVLTEVRWVRHGDSERGLRPGLGVRFLNLPDADRRTIERFVRKRDPIFYDE